MEAETAQDILVKDNQWLSTILGDPDRWTVQTWRDTYGLHDQLGSNNKDHDRPGGTEAQKGEEFQHLPTELFDSPLSE